MKGPVAASGRDLRALARIVTDDRGELPAEGLAPSLLSDLVQLIGCDFVVFGGTDSSQQADWFGQTVPAEADDPTFNHHAFWTHYWDSTVQPPRAHRRPAKPGEGLGFLLSPAMAQHRHVPRLLPAARGRARADGVPARRPRVDRRTRAEPAPELHARARRGFFRPPP